MTMRDLMLDPVTDDLVPNATVSDGDAIRQDVETALRLAKGEWFLSGDGVDYAGTIFGKASDATVLAELRRVIEGRWGVRAVVSISLQRDGLSRTALVTFTAVTTLGTLGPVTVQIGA
jgi:hypothetical protein